MHEKQNGKTWHLLADDKYVSAHCMLEVSFPIDSLTVDSYCDGK